ncbi:shikimate dehydrogenase [Roseovarius sp.]|uniref:shikimate dehydrogenase n=1 Tax=Roseovarius sp. TaxID=1486281 RepID=UPI00262E2B49|nr:shikimate dehydrogenase [Roseovarius sp.]MDM8167876.1 shikimate dehydrogenase [Roseovarius sp.]
MEGEVHAPMHLDGSQDGRPETDQPMLRLGLVGRGIQLSRTPAMHEAEAAAHGLRCRYVLLDSDAGAGDDLAAILDRAEADGFAGLNVTFPYKQAVMDHLDGVSEAAERIGAVNTVVFRDGGRFGHNTDFRGFSESVRRGLQSAAMDRVLLLGAGGAGAAVGFALADLGVNRLMIADTRPGAAAALAGAIGMPAEAVEDVPRAVGLADGIVNATPVGMAKLPGTPVSPALLQPRHWVADIVYFPLETELLKAARGTGCRVLSGAGMAVFQAVRAFELFTGRTADPDRMRQTFQRLAPPEGEQA